MFAEFSSQWIDGVFSLWGMIIVAIITGTIVSVTGMIIRHRERIAMIERGIRPPDAANDEE
jgi:hypothetical protein